jgi:hypothetical protein
MPIDEKLKKVRQDAAETQTEWSMYALIDAVRDLEKRCDDLEEYAAHIAAIIGPTLTVIEGGKGKGDESS